MAPRAVVAQAAALYGERQPTIIDVQAAGGVDVGRRVGEGEAADVIVLANDAIEKLVTSGKLLSAGKTALMESEIAIGVRTGTVKPRLADEQSLQALVLDAPSLSYSTGPSGQYLEKLFAKWVIADQIRARIVVPPPGVPVARLIADGKIALGFQQLSELIDVPGVDVAGTLPPALQLVTTFTAAIAAGCENKVEAQRFAEFAASEALDTVRKRHGMSAAHR